MKMNKLTALFALCAATAFTGCSIPSISLPRPPARPVAHVDVDDKGYVQFKSGDVHLSGQAIIFDCAYNTYTTTEKDDFIATYPSPETLKRTGDMIRIYDLNGSAPNTDFPVYTFDDPEARILDYKGGMSEADGVFKSFEYFTERMQQSERDRIRKAGGFGILMPPPRP